MKANRIQIDRINKPKKVVQETYFEGNNKKYLVKSDEIEVFPIKQVEYWNKKATR